MIFGAVKYNSHTGIIRIYTVIFNGSIIYMAQIKVVRASSKNYIHTVHVLAENSRIDL